MKLVILVSLALLCTLGQSTFTIERFMGPPFSVKPPSGLYELGGLGFDNVVGVQVIAYGDFNNDKFTDIIALQDDTKTLNVFLYSHKNFTFVPTVPIVLDNSVASVIPADYNYDGKLDLLVITTSANGDQTYFEYFFNLQEAPYFGGDPDVSSTVAGITQPFILDTEGDRHANLLYMDSGVRTVQTIGNGGVQTQTFDQHVSTDASCIAYSTVQNRQFSSPHSNAFIDFNGDCAADLFITSVDENNQLYFEIWLRNPADAKFCLVESTPISYASISLVSLGDMNNDGRMDLVYASMPEISTDPMNIHVIYNQAPYDTSSPCTLAKTEMVSPFATGAYNSNTTAGGINQVVQVQLQGNLSTSSRLFSRDPVNRPSKIRLGDINIDGYPDLLFVVNDPTSGDTVAGSVVLVINRASTITFDQSQLDEEDAAYYILLDSETFTDRGDKALGAISALSASFFDFDEYGRLGIWIVTYDKTSPNTNLIGAFNFVNTENFILKTLGLNGIAPTEDDEITQTIGGIYYGASVECTITDINGASTLSKGAQLPQSAYTPLDLPYVFIGLGRTNNYIENFVMGISKTNGGANDLQQMTWTPIIPNSQLIVNPLVEKEWTLDVFVNPTAETALVILTTVIILIVLGAIIINQHLKEKKEDVENRTHLINF